MAKVSIQINGRKYALGCDDGEEERLLGLGQTLDERITQLADQFGQIGDLRLLVMAGITLTDELTEAKDQIQQKAESLSTDIQKESEASLARAERSELRATDSLLDAAQRIEKLAQRLSQQGQDD